MGVSSHECVIHRIHGWIDHREIQMDGKTQKEMDEKIEKEISAEINRPKLDK
jgi:hypothetical protein